MSLGTDWLKKYQQSSQGKASAAASVGTSVAKVTSGLLTTSAGRTIFPVPGYTASPTSIAPGHRALDIPAPIGTRAVAAKGGTVQVEQGEYGLTVRIRDFITGLEQIYGHLSQALVKSGQVVMPGQTVGLVGLSGEHSGGVSHLHYEVNPIGREDFQGGRADVAAVDPWAFLKGYQTTAASTAGLQPFSVATATPTRPLSAAALKSVATRTISPAAISAPSVVGTATTLPTTTGTKAATDTGGVLGLGWLKSAIDPDVKDSAAAKAKGFVGRAGFVWAGFTLVILGVALFAFTYRQEIAKVGGSAVGAAAGNPGAIAGGVSEAVGAAAGA